MTVVSWRGQTAVVDDGEQLVEVDCSGLARAVDPVQLQGCVDRVTFPSDGSVWVFVEDAGRTMMGTGFNELPPGRVAVEVGGVVLGLGMVQFQADAGPDAKIIMVFEPTGDGRCS
ncbi:hypothetical protein DSM104299_00995 [Baekduia alba]|uniref:hypothetical protein n=1 Tax=Baekduia alba TaxID=2997333 RepID=UPI002341DC1A|nr:hypothetical protein [Baekduia alba]WCB92305.1 hypothetical protein DSM104299_00995 [Baekduia alba]